MGCNRLESIDTFIDVGAQLSHSDFGPVDQQVLGLTASYSNCISSRSRVVVEGSYSEVNEEGRHSRAALAGIGLQTELSPRLTMMPFIHIGVEKSSGGGSRLLLNGGAIVSTWLPLNREEEGPTLDLALRAEYTDRRVPSGLLPGGSRHHGTFENTASAGVDFALGKKFRSKAAFVHQYLDGARPTDSIANLVLSLRRLTPERTSYRWNADLWFSRGNGGFQRVLLGISMRFGSGRAVGAAKSGAQ